MKLKAETQAELTFQLHRIGKLSDWIAQPLLGHLQLLDTIDTFVYNYCLVSRFKTLVVYICASQNFDLKRPPRICLARHPAWKRLFTLIRLAARSWLRRMCIYPCQLKPSGRGPSAGPSESGPLQHTSRSRSWLSKFSTVDGPIRTHKDCSVSRSWC